MTHKKHRRILRLIVFLLFVCIALAFYLAFCTQPPPPPPPPPPPSPTFTSTSAPPTWTPTNTATFTPTSTATSTRTPTVTRTKPPAPPTVTFTPVSPLNYKWWNCYTQTWMDYPRYGWHPCSQAKVSE